MIIILMVTYSCYAWTAMTSFEELREDSCDEMYCVTLSYTFGVKLIRLNAYLVQSNKSDRLRGPWQVQGGLTGASQVRPPPPAAPAALPYAQAAGHAYSSTASGCGSRWHHRAVCQRRSLSPIWVSW